MRILVTNDDGIYSPGLVALAGVAARFGSIRIVAPDVEQSSMAFAVTATRPLRHRHVSIAGFDAFRVDGTPADCVALGTHLWGNVNVVVSGVVRLYDGRVIPTKDPWGSDVFWFAPTPREGPEPGTDRHAVEEGLVSITPLRLDLTDEENAPASAE